MPSMPRQAARRLLAAVALAFTALLTGPAWAGGAAAAFDRAAAATRQPTTDRLIVKYRDARPGAAMHPDRLQRLQERAARQGVQLAHLRSTALGAHVLQLDQRLGAAQAQALAAQLKADDAGIEYAEPDRVLHPLAVPNDSYYGYQWDLFEATGGIRAPQAWDLATGSGVVVGVIDTGYRPHADLAANVLPGYDFIRNAATAADGGGRDADAQDPGDATAVGECAIDSPATDSSWHGTHVAGTVAAVGNNASGVIGIAYHAKVLPLRALGKCGGYTSDIADAIVWGSGGSVSGVPANATPARVLNLSLGGGGACDATTQAAINSARSRNTVVVVAAGNSADDAAGYSPASCAGVIAVAATDRYGARAYYSNYGASVSLAAPGGDMRSTAANGILSTLNNGITTPGSDAYAYYQGTSMAAPHVAAVAALMLSRNPALTADQVAARLKGSARAFPGGCSGCGAGLLDAYAAVQAAAPAPAPTPTGTVAEIEPNNTTGTATVVSASAVATGNLSATNDADFFTITLPAGHTLTATLNAPSTANYSIYVYNAIGGVASAHSPQGQPDKASYTNPGNSPLKLYVKVAYFSGSLGGTYTLDLRW